MKNVNRMTIDAHGQIIRMYVKPDHRFQESMEAKIVIPGEIVNRNAALNQTPQVTECSVMLFRDNGPPLEPEIEKITGNHQCPLAHFNFREQALQSLDLNLRNLR